MENIDLDRICKEADSKTLAAHVITFRHLGMNKELAIKCMEELVRRENDGDTFDYKTFIEDTLKDMPSIRPDKSTREMWQKLIKMDFRNL